jgi:hypothetical protein
MEYAGWVREEIVRARVPLRDQAAADSFGDRLRAVDHSELPPSFARAARMSLSAPFGDPDFSPEA